MANLQNTFKGLLFTVFRWSLCAYRVSNILESLLWNFYITKLRFIRWPVWKILSHASEPSFSATSIVLTISRTLWSSYLEIVTLPYYGAKDGRFAKFCHTPLNRRFYLVIWCLSSESHFGALSMKFSLHRIAAQTMTYLQNTIKRPGIIVASKCFAADHQCDILELLL